MNHNFNHFITAVLALVIYLLIQPPIYAQYGICGQGTAFNEETGECEVFVHFDFDSNGTIGVIDLLEFLASFGTPIQSAPCSCNNGGTCNDDICECPAGFVGAFCETVSPPNQVVVNEIRLLNNWFNDCFDSFFEACPPDIYIKVEYNGNAFYSGATDLLIYTSGYYTDPGYIELTFGADFTYKLFHPSFEIEVWDHDSNGDEFIDRLTFVPMNEYDPVTGFYPSTWHISTTMFDVELDVTYQW